MNLPLHSAFASQFYLEQVFRIQVSIYNKKLYKLKWKYFLGKLNKRKVGRDTYE